MTLPQSLLDAWNDNEELLNELVQEYSRKFPQIQTRLAALLAAQPKNSEGRLIGEISEQMVKAIVRDSGFSGFKAAVKEALRDERVSRMGVLGSLADDVLEPSMRSLALAALDRTVETDFSTIEAAFSKVTTNTLEEMALVPLPKKQVVERIQPILNRTKAQTATLLDTALAGFQTELQRRAADTLPDQSNVLFVYTGPEDVITRPFCKALVGKAVRKQDIQKLKNGQGLPVARYRGGYNCRHALVPVASEFVKLSGIPIATKADIGRANRGGRR